ncbi:hypothetical protein IWZ01DRAFT_494808 [Phyllosticta capitalensis]
MDSLELLVEHEAKLDLENDSGLNAVSGAAFEGEIEVIKFLLEKGASGAPPSKYRGKWKHQTFSYDIGPVTRSEVMRILREAKRK